MTTNRKPQGENVTDRCDESSMTDMVFIYNTLNFPRFCGLLRLTGSKAREIQIWGSPQFMY
jgi:hypothetical protein